MSGVALLNAPTELGVAREMLLLAKGRLEKIENMMLRNRATGHEQYVERFAQIQELTSLIKEMEKLLSKRERET